MRRYDETAIKELMERYGLLFGSLLAAAAFSALVLTVLSGCDSAASDSTQQVVLGELVDLAEGDTVRLGANGPLLTFVEVRDDSRCPVDVMCVWAGEARADFSLSGPASHARFTLKISGLVSTPYEENEGVSVGSHRFTLLELRPYPVESADPPERYSALIRAEWVEDPD